MQVARCDSLLIVTDSTKSSGLLLHPLLSAVLYKRKDGL